MKFYTLYPPKLMIVTQYIQIGLPTADLDCDLAQYADIICGKESRKGLIDPLHAVGVSVGMAKHVAAILVHFSYILLYPCLYSNMADSIQTCTKYHIVFFGLEYHRSCEGSICS